MQISFCKKIVAFLLLSAGLTAEAQTVPLTIDSCYGLARQNYPLIKKQDLIAKTRGYSLKNASTLFLPQLSVTGQASYQSQTIDFPEVLGGIPGVSLPAISKDQYRIQAEITQQIYDGGSSRNQKELIRADEAIQQQSLEVSLNSLRERINQIYFSILLLGEQLKQNEIRKADLQSILDKASVALRNGTGFRSNVDELKAELISADMTDIAFNSGRKAYLKMLSLLIGRPVGETTVLVQPVPPPILAGINRPELRLYDLQKKRFDISETQLRSGYLPKLSAFVQAAYGRPTLNIIENQFGAWWIGGLRLNWTLGSLYTLKNNRDLLAIGRSNEDVEKETFLFNTRLILSQQNESIQKYRELIRKDDAAISLRASVTESAKAQLDNGVITVHEYISKLNDENMARQSRILHQIQLLQALYNFKSTSGN